MRLTIVGCSGSFPGPESAASCYLLEAPFEGRTFRLVLDLGSGALGPLQEYIDLRDIDAISLSHLHADHCFDMSGLYVVRKYHPAGAPPKIPVYAPPGSDWQLSNAYGTTAPNGMTLPFEFHDLVDGLETTVGPFTVTARRTPHPVEAYAVRIEHEGRVLVYSGDTGPDDGLAEFAAGADVFLCEASFVESAENPPDLHLTGADAGRIAGKARVGRLLLTHIPPWTDRDEVEADLATTWSGERALVRPGDVVEL
ncbi:MULTISPECIES: MBL fold metallo-hydrolase [Aeromicrobium]|uniref:MBL fold metallo-hydrolase n=1 Tax=Aeromicrobium phoceense TaxID=2754045 RepID=A0A838XR80_9ACTN|nr:MULTISPECIES: MBL fold metallo-hydrolase [Aeromicrobium]MBA4609493.1 MBL fold metallo-hydrolase [Aeromicrobium phoceense]